MPLAVVRLRKVYYELHGAQPGSGAPLVLLEGMGGTCRGWLPLQVPAFSEAHPTLIFDHRGVGESEDPGGTFSTADLADDAAALLEELGVERAAVLGAFMGGMVAQELALRHPERVERLILVGTYARPDAKRRMLLQQWRDLARAPIPLETKIRERVVWTFQDETLEQTDLIDAMMDFYAREAPSPFTGDLFARQCEACMSHDTLERLGGIRQRTLILYGQHDALTPAKFHRQLADGIPHAQLVALPYGAHLVMAESAQRFNETVLHFLEEKH